MKDRVQIKNPTTNRWVKINAINGKIMSHKKDYKPYKRIKKI